jgi:CheY-like chemotaxis protein
MQLMPRSLPEPGDERRPPPAEGDPTATPRAARILVVEDDALLAMELAATLEGAGHRVVGPAHSVPEAFARVRGDAPIDAALLDVDLRGETVAPVADALAAHGVPFAFVTGRPDGLPGHPGVALLRKPAPPALVLAVLGSPLAAQR